MRILAKSLSVGAVALAFGALLTGCSGGGTPAAPNSGNLSPQGPKCSDGCAVGQVLSEILNPASNQPVKLVAGAPVPNVSDVDASIAAPALAPGVAAQFASSTTIGYSHAAQTVSLTSAFDRKRNVSATNSPLDLNYFGGPVLGSAVSNPVYVNCALSCRSQTGLLPGKFLADLSNDPFVSIAYQYLASPGVALSPPVTGRFTLGQAVDVSYTPTTADTVAGFTNPVLSIPDLLGILIQGIEANGGLDAAHNHIYDLFLPPNYDTCLDANDTVCYSPDNPSSFVFCAYHDFATTQSGFPIYLTVEPDQGVPGCEPPTNLPFPHPNPRTDAQDSSLSHETFETITDPQGSAWRNLLTGSEIGDLCAYFDNFVTISRDPYLIQSEYSDIGSECISANLTNPNVVTAP